MALTERLPEPFSVSPFVTDVNNGSAATRRKLKAIFLEKDRFQINHYIKDLEKTIILNKEIISDLIGSKGGNINYKQILGKINQENMNLQLKVKELINERNSLQSKYRM